jgi:hypothetical protein
MSILSEAELDARSINMVATAAQAHPGPPVHKAWHLISLDVTSDQRVETTLSIFDPVKHHMIDGERA